MSKNNAVITPIAVAAFASTSLVAPNSSAQYSQNRPPAEVTNYAEITLERIQNLDVSSAKILLRQKRFKNDDGFKILARSIDNVRLDALIKTCTKLSNEVHGQDSDLEDKLLDANEIFIAERYARGRNRNASNELTTQVSPNTDYYNPENDTTANRAKKYAAVAAAGSKFIHDNASPDNIMSAAQRIKELVDMATPYVIEGAGQAEDILAAVAVGLNEYGNRRQTRAERLEYYRNKPLTENRRIFLHHPAREFWLNTTVSDLKHLSAEKIETLVTSPNDARIEVLDSFGLQKLKALDQRLNSYYQNELVDRLVARKTVDGINKTTVSGLMHIVSYLITELSAQQSSNNWQDKVNQQKVAVRSENLGLNDDKASWLDLTRQDVDKLVDGAGRG